jgi:hypothetical protein
MKYICLFLLCGLLACNDSAKSDTGTTDSSEVENKTDSQSASPVTTEKPVPTLEPDSTKTYNNVRFRNVKATRLEGNRFRITGEGQIFEASFGWVIEDGHKELGEGFATTDAGAPAWGKFSFEVKAEKERPNSTLHLVLFETSMKDGSRQHELPIRLY